MSTTQKSERMKNRTGLLFINVTRVGFLSVMRINDSFSSNKYILLSLTCAAFWV